MEAEAAATAGRSQTHSPREREAEALDMSEPEPPERTSSLGERRFERLEALASIGAWVAVVTTFAGALGTHIVAARYAHMVATYMATAKRLESVATRVAQQVFQVPSDTWPVFVKECEDTISIENEAWMAKWTDPQ